MFDDRMAALETEYEAVETELADPATLSDQDRLRDLSRRHKELGDIVRAWHELTAAREDVTTAREMLTETSGDERELMRQEVDVAETLVATLEERIQTLLLPEGSQRGPQRDHGDPGRGGGRRGEPVRPRALRHVPALRRREEVEGRDPLGGRVGQGRHQRGRLPREGPRRLHPAGARGEAPTGCSACPSPRQREGSTPPPPR